MPRLSEVDSRTAPNADRCADGRCCGECDGGGAVFYVTVVDGERFGYLAGPYESHQESLDAVDYARDKANEADSRAAFYGFGTARVSGEGENPKAVFGRL